MEIPPYLEERIRFVAAYIGTATTDWLIVKSNIANNSKPEYRAMFSRRHMYTKKQVLNELDLAVMKFWTTLTNVELQIDPKKLHDPNWIHDKPSGWALNGGKERYDSKK